jgi:hypothetical protein
MKGKKYDVGMGRQYFYLYIKGKKNPIARILATETYGTKDVEVWAKKEYMKHKLKGVV